MHMYMYVIYICTGVYMFPYGYQKRDRLGIRQREEEKTYFRSFD